MKNKRYSDEEAFQLLLQIDDKISSGIALANACHAAGITDSTYYNWTRKYRHLRPAVIRENRELKKENAKLKKTITDISGEIRTLQQYLKNITTNH